MLLVCNFKGVLFQAGYGGGEEKSKLCILRMVSEMITLKVCSSITKISKTQLKSLFTKD